MTQQRPQRLRDTLSNLRPRLNNTHNNINNTVEQDLEEAIQTCRTRLAQLRPRVRGLKPAAGLPNAKVRSGSSFSDKSLSIGHQGNKADWSQDNLYDEETHA